MRLPGADNWLKSPLDRDVIAHWTVGKGKGMTYALDLPPPPDLEHFTFLALGDTGDSEASGPKVSPQDAVAREMARDAALPDSTGKAALVVHTGDVVYMTGERRLYDRNFRQPYAPFLAPQSTVDAMVFRLPFLPVPGNHDYYDLKGWTRWLARIPLLGAGVRAIAHELFAFSLPVGGSEMGKAYMQAFVDSVADTAEAPLPYIPGERTRLPNRYYKFRLGNVDFFALDSNTLDAPPPGTNADRVHQEANRSLPALEARAQELDQKLRRRQLALDRWRSVAQQEVSTDAERQAAVMQVCTDVGNALAELQAANEEVKPEEVKSEEIKSEEPKIDEPKVADSSCTIAAQTVAAVQQRWTATADDLSVAVDATALLDALKTLDAISDDACTSVGAVESCLAMLPEGPGRTRLLAARDALQKALHRWSQVIASVPLEEAKLMHQLSEDALDVQRELALERRRLRYTSDDFDNAQRQWLEASLAEALRERPDGWRIVYLHHPLYTTISNHCERPDVQGLRANILELLQGRVHLILSGHSHAFEWFRSDALPNTGIFVTGGGGQTALRPTLLESDRLQRHRSHYMALRANGVRECAVAGRGPLAADGEDGPLYHYLRIDVTPEALIVRPVGVRRLSNGYRREEPMPVLYAAELPDQQPLLHTRCLEAVEIRRDRPPRPRWS